MRRLVIMLSTLLLLISGCSKPAIMTNKTIAKDFNPIVIKPPRSEIGILLGAFNKKWLSADKASSYIKGEEEYKLLSLAEYLEVGSAKTVSTDNRPIQYTIKFDSNVSHDDGFLAISCDWNLIPRRPVQQSNSSEAYNNIVSQILEENGLKDIPVNIVQNYKIDLEGDGQDEVLLCATNIKPLGFSATFKKNTYSLVVMRKIIDKRVENIFLTKSIYLEDGKWENGCPIIDNIEAIADLDGDGEMEIVTSYLYYEGYGYKIYDLVKNKLDLVLQSTYGGK